MLRHKGFVGCQPCVNAWRLHANQLVRNAGSAVGRAPLRPLVDHPLGALRHEIEDRPRGDRQRLQHDGVEPFGCARAAQGEARGVSRGRFE